MSKGSYQEHQALLKKWQIEVTRFNPEIITLENPVGMFRDFETAERIIRIGQKGTLDNQLILPGGKILFFDVKTGKYSNFTKEQKFFKERVDKTCGYEAAFKLRDIDKGLEILEKYL